MMNDDYPLNVAPDQGLKTASFLAQLDPASIAELLVHHFKGESWDPSKQEWIHTDGREQMNDRGVRDIISLFTFFFNQNTVLTNLSDREICIKTVAFGDSLAEMVALNWKEYEVEKSLRTPICLAITDIINNALRRSLVGQGSKIITDKALLDSTQRSVVQQNITESRSEKKGILPFFK